MHEFYYSAYQQRKKITLHASIVTDIVVILNKENQVQNENNESINKVGPT